MNWLGDIFPCVTIRYCIIINRVPENFPVVLFLMAVMYFALIAKTSCYISARSTTRISWNIRRFLSY